MNAVEHARRAPDQVQLVRSADELEQALLPLPQVECPITHHFAPGVYGRQMSAPGGTLILGHSHKEAHLCFLLSGRLILFTSSGPQHLQAPAIIRAEPGRKLGLAITDLIWITLHPNPSEERDTEALEDAMVTKSAFSIAWQRQHASIEGAI